MSKQADYWIRWYFAKREDAGAPAIDLVESRGWIYAPECGAELQHGKVCDSKTRHSTKHGFYVCGVCGNLWRFEERFSLVGEVQTSPRADHFEASISTVVDVGRLYSLFIDDPRWRWKARLYVAHVLGWTRDDLLHEGPVAFAEAGTSIRWTPWGIRTAIHEARQEWARRLRTIGIVT